MASKRYHKLVRDRIPEIIRKEGELPTVRILESDADFLKAALAKVVEEAIELQVATTKKEFTKEIADLLEIIDAVARVQGIRNSRIKRERKRRAQKRGTFQKRLFLIRVTKKRGCE